MYKQTHFFCPKPYPPTETTELDPRACLAYTEQGAQREIAKINLECASLAREIKPVRAFLESAYRRLAAINQQRHTLDLFIFQDKLRKIPRGVSGLISGLVNIHSREDFIDWLDTLSPDELRAFQDYLGEKEESE